MRCLQQQSPEAVADHDEDKDHERHHGRHERHHPCELRFALLVHALRTDARPPLESVLAEMAEDPQMQRELAEINQEFASTEWDGLEQR